MIDEEPVKLGKIGLVKARKSKELNWILSAVEIGGRKPLDSFVSYI